MNEELDDISPSGEGAGEAKGPSPFVGELSEQDVLDRLGLVNELPNQVRGVEERLGGMLSPLQEQLQRLQASRAQQPVFEPKLDSVNQALRDYDSTLAEKLSPALEQALKESFSYSPLDADALRPHMEPALNELRSQLEIENAFTILDTLPFDPDSVVNREGDPSTDIQKDFAQWYGQVDSPTRKALAAGEGGAPASPLLFARAMQQFGKWRAKRIQDKGEEAGNASRRLAGAVQTRSSGRTSPPSRGPEDDFKAGIEAVRSQYSR